MCSVVYMNAAEDSLESHTIGGMIRAASSNGVHCRGSCWLCSSEKMQLLNSHHHPNIQLVTFNF